MSKRLQTAAYGRRVNGLDCAAVQLLLEKLGRVTRFENNWIFYRIKNRCKVHARKNGDISGGMGAIN